MVWIALLWIPIAVLASYQSYEPTVGGRWSGHYFAVLLTCAAASLLGTILLLKAISPDRQGSPRYLVWLTRLRRRSVLSIAALACPPAAWLVLALGMAVVQPGPVLYYRAILILLDLAVLTAAVMMLLLFSATADRERRLRKFQCVLVMAGFFVGLLVAESLARLLGVEPPDQFWLNPSSIRIPYQTEEFDTLITTNRQGLRGSEEYNFNRSGITRVMVIGDSMTFGHGVNDDETYTTVAQQMLNEQGRGEMELVNVSRNGAGPGDYLNYVRHYADQLNPKLVIIGFYTGNDCPVQQPFEIRSPRQLQALHDLILFRSHRTLCQRSTLCRLVDRRVVKPIRNRWMQGMSRPGPGVSDPFTGQSNELGTILSGTEPDEPTQRRLDILEQKGWIAKGLNGDVNPGLISAVLLHPNAVADSMFLREDTRESMHVEWQLCRSILLEIAQSARQLSARLLLLIIPQAYQVDPTCVEQLNEFGCLSMPAMLENRTMNDLLVEFCHEQDIHCLDPLAQFRAETTSGNQLYYPIDSHLNADGQQLLGELLAEKIEQIMGE